MSEEHPLSDLQTDGQSRISSPPPALTPSPLPLFGTLAIVGVGLMGGSVGLAVKKRGLAGRVVGIDSDPAMLRLAEAREAVDTGTISLQDGVKEADFVILATPISVSAVLLPILVPLLLETALVTDVGSAKGEIVEAGERLLGARFIGGHPMAGSEKSGVGASRADLFAGRPWAVVRDAEVSEPDVSSQRLAKFAAALEAVPVFLNSSLHDKTVAIVSHLPHVLAYAFTGAAQKALPPNLLWKLAGSSFRDFTRIAYADPDLWAGIFLANRDALLQTLDGFEASLGGLRKALQQGEFESLKAAIELRQLSEG